MAVGAHHLVNLAGHVFVDGQIGVGGVTCLNVIFQELAENRTGDGGVFPCFCQLHHRGSISLADNLHVNAIAVEFDKFIL